MLDYTIVEAVSLQISELGNGMAQQLARLTVKHYVWAPRGELLHIIKEDTIRRA